MRAETAVTKKKTGADQTAAVKKKIKKKSCCGDTAGFFFNANNLLGSIFGVEQVVSLLASGSSEILGIEFLDIRVFVRKTQSLAGILGIETLHALFKQRGVAMQEGLTAAVDTTAGAGHDFDSLETVGIGTDHVQNLAGIAQSGADCNGDDLSGSDFNFGFLDAVQTADNTEVDGIAFEVLAVEHIVDGAAGSFENTAGNTEDVSGTAGFTQGAVEGVIIQVGEVDTGFAEHLAEFAGGDNVVNITDAVIGEFRTGGFVFLGLAGHDGNNNQILGIHADLFGIEALGDGAEHLLRRFAAGRNVEQIRIVVLDEVDPSGAAAGEDRQILAGFDAFDDLVAFFHDGQVSREVGVENFVKAQSAESGNHFTGDRHAGFKSEFLTDSNADGGSSLNDNGLLGIVDGVPDFLDVADTGDGTDGAGVDALSAEGTAGVSQRNHAGGTDLGGKSAAVAGQSADGLNFVTDGFAAAAHDTFRKIAHDRFAGIINVKMVLGAGKGDFLDAEFSSQNTQFAVLVLGAGETLLGVIAEHQFQNGAAGIQSALAVGVDHHAFHDRSGAGGSQVAAAFNFHHANTAAGGVVGDTAAQTLAVAEGRNLDIEFAGGFQNGGAGRYGNLLAVNSKIDSIIHCCTHSLTIAFFGHPSIQAPHLIHLAASMVWSCLSSPWMASTGQLRLHLVQPMQDSLMVRV